MQRQDHFTSIYDRNDTNIRQNIQPKYNLLHHRRVLWGLTPADATKSTRRIRFWWSWGVTSKTDAKSYGATYQGLFLSVFWVQDSRHGGCSRRFRECPWWLPSLALCRDLFQDVHDVVHTDRTSLRLMEAWWRNLMLALGLAKSPNGFLQQTYRSSLTDIKKVTKPSADKKTRHLPSWRSVNAPSMFLWSGTSCYIAFRILSYIVGWYLPAMVSPVSPWLHPWYLPVTSSYEDPCDFTMHM